VVSHIMVGGHVLNDSIRTYLATTWDAEIFDKVGSNETGHMGFDCREHNGFHILPGPNYLEVLDIETGEPVKDSTTTGEIVVTAFLNTGTPLLRYRIGDIGTIDDSPCNCGLNFPRIFFKGRLSGAIAFGGTKIYGTEIDEVVSKLSNITQNYQVVIENSGRTDTATFYFECNDVKDESLPEELERLLDQLHKISSTVYDKVQSGSARMVIRPVPLGHLQRSAGDKIANQFLDKRT